MFYYLNKIVWIFLNPLTLSLLLAVSGAGMYVFARDRRRRIGAIVLFFALALLWFFSSGLCVLMLGVPLERPYLATQRPETLPYAHAIVLLGGGIGYDEGLEYPEMFEAADRVWHAARLYRAGKAPVIVVSGQNDLYAAVPLLRDLGVPDSSIIVDNESRNTYENSRFTEKLLNERFVPSPYGPQSPSVLLVTSAWHMPRACGNFSKTKLTVFPAACDFKATFSVLTKRGLLDLLLPNTDNLNTVNFLSKEWVGRLARK